jgi:hypothetical protein
MPERNRVTPEAELIAVSDRGRFMGNRGVLHDDSRVVVRQFQGNRWLICLTRFNGRWRALRTPGRLTELFFLDEATALAAGHRPCGQCRHAAYRTFRDAYRRAFPADPAGASAIDRRLHADRLTRQHAKRTYAAAATDLPDGTIIRHEGQAWLVLAGWLLAWSPGGYQGRRPMPGLGLVTVLTPRATVATLAAGYLPQLDASARIL